MFGTKKRTKRLIDTESSFFPILDNKKSCVILKMIIWYNIYTPLNLYIYQGLKDQKGILQFVTTYIYNDLSQKVSKPTNSYWQKKNYVGYSESIC